MSTTIEALAERLDPREQAQAALSRSQRWGRGVVELAREVAHEAAAQRARQVNGRGTAA
ncbi:MAG: hypothetical protein ACRD0K_02115 [Egibacteraceae bacterium]